MYVCLTYLSENKYSCFCLRYCFAKLIEMLSLVYYLKKKRLYAFGISFLSTTDL